MERQSSKIWLIVLLILAILCLLCLLVGALGAYLWEYGDIIFGLTGRIFRQGIFA
jgi:hypothetical protein